MCIRDRAFTTEEIVQGMAAGVRSGQITPVFCGSAVNGQALDMLIYNMNVLLRGADTASAVGEANGEPVEITADPAAPPVSYTHLDVYKRQPSPRHCPSRKLKYGSSVPARATYTIRQLC